MNEQLVSLETAKLLKEKGFDIKCLWWYDLSTNKLSCFENSYRYQQRQLEKEINTPTQSLAQKWLRETHNLDIFVIPNFAPIYSYNNSERIIEGHNIKERVFDVYTVCIFKNRKSKYHSSFYDSYEQALEAGLIEALKLIK